MKQSESITKLLESFCKAQGEFPTLPKDKNGYNYKYTDLDTVISTVRPILAKYNIGFMQSLTTLENGSPAITTRLFNNAGEWIEDTTPLPNVSLSKGNAAQNTGAAITYMKRYTLCAMLGISSDEDPDGNPELNKKHSENWNYLNNLFNSYENLFKKNGDAYDSICKALAGNDENLIIQTAQRSLEYLKAGGINI